MYTLAFWNVPPPNRNRQSLSASNHFLADNRPLLQDTVSRSRSHRNSTFPSLKVPESIFEGRASGAFLDGSSTIGSAEFDFDDDVVNSTVYRRAMATATKRHKNMKRTKSVVEGDLIDLSELGSDDETEMAESSTRDLEELLPRDSSTLKGSHTRTGTMETLQEEQEPKGDSPRSRRLAADQRSQASSMGFSPRVTGPVHTHLYPPADGRVGAHTPTLTITSNGATIDSQSVKSNEARYDRLDHTLQQYTDMCLEAMQSHLGDQILQPLL